MTVELSGPAHDAAELSVAPEPETWAAVCAVEEILPERGVAALLGDIQVAIFRTHDGVLFATTNRDPYSGAMVMSRGIVGTRGAAPTVASPMHKQVFDLRDGRCLDAMGQEAVGLMTYAVAERGGVVHVGLPGRNPGS